MKKRALAIWPAFQSAAPKLEPELEKPVLVKVPEEQWNHEEEVLKRGRLEEYEHHREKVQRLVPGLDLKRWMF